MSLYGTVEPSSTQARPRSTSRTATRAAGPGQWPVGDHMTPPPRPAGRQRGITAWPIRRKLAALVAVPMTAILIGSGALIGATLSDLRDARQARELAAVGIVVNQMSRALLDERTTSIANLRKSTEETKAALAKARGATDEAAAAMTTTLADTPVRGWAPEVEGEMAGARDAVAHLEDVRDSATAMGRSTDGVMNAYTARLAALNALTRALNLELQQQTSGSATSDGAATLAALTQAAIASSEERDVLYSALAMRDQQISEQDFTRLALLRATQLKQLEAARNTATTEQGTAIGLVEADDNQLDRFRLDSAYLLPQASDDGTPGDAEEFASAAQSRISEMEDVINTVATQTREDAASAENSAWVRAVLAGTGALLVLLFVIAATAAIGRTITDPLRRLRSGAVDVANARLPAAVRQIEGEGPDSEVEVPPVLPPGTKAGPETIEVASAVDGLTATAIRLASAQTHLRRTLDQAFVNMSRRSQTMVEKQLGIIDELESTEQDPDQLRNLFRLDHLAARMRRYNDNLLVLAGSAVRTRSSAPVPVSELFRAATSEMEQYERVRLAPVTGASVVGSAAGGLVHLIAELLDNAAMYSPPTSPIVLSAAFSPDGGLVIEIQDSGVGIPAVELQRINGRLAESEGQDLSIPSRMGLFVVGRLAHRGNFRVWLRQRQGAPGTIAEVSVPSNLVLGGPGSTGEQPPVATQALGFGAPPPAAPPQAMPIPIPVIGPPRSPLPLPSPAGAAGAVPPAPSTLDTTRGGVTSATEEGAAPLPRRPLQQRPGSGAPVDPLGGPTTSLPSVPEPAAPGLMFGTAEDPTAVPPAAPRDDALSTATWRIADDSGPLPVRSVQRGDVVAAATAAAAAAPPIINLTPPTESTGRAPQAWDEALPAELLARLAPNGTVVGSSFAGSTAADATLIGDPPGDDDDDMFSTPIFNSISAWFADEEVEGLVDGEPAVAEAAEQADGADSRPAQSRWAALGDQRWIAASARAAAAPTTAGKTETGLPLRRPGANLIPTASSAAAPRGAQAGAVRSGPPARGQQPAQQPAQQLGNQPAGGAAHNPAQVSPANPFGLPVAGPINGLNMTGPVPPTTPFSSAAPQSRAQAPASAGAPAPTSAPLPSRASAASAASASVGNGLPVRPTGAAAAFSRRGDGGQPGRLAPQGPTTGPIGPVGAFAGAGPAAYRPVPVSSAPGALPAPSQVPGSGAAPGGQPGQGQPSRQAPAHAPAQARANGSRLTSPPPVNSAGVSADAEAVRGRLGSYQRGLSSARQARRQALANGEGGTSTGTISTAPPEGSTDASTNSAGQGGDQ